MTEPLAFSAHKLWETPAPPDPLIHTQNTHTFSLPVLHTHKHTKSYNTEQSTQAHPSQIYSGLRLPLCSLVLAAAQLYSG